MKVPPRRADTPGVDRATLTWTAAPDVVRVIGRLYPGVWEAADPASGHPGFVVAGQRSAIRRLKPTKTYTVAAYPVDAAGNVDRGSHLTFTTGPTSGSRSAHPRAAPCRAQR